MEKKAERRRHAVKKYVIWILVLCLLLPLWGCGKGEQEDIVEELEGPEGIELFAGLWYYEARNLWIEIYYDGAWCSFEDGGMLRSHGDLTITEDTAVLEPKEGEDRFSLQSFGRILSDEGGNSLIRVTEVGITKPPIINDLGIPDTISSMDMFEGEAAPDFCKEHAGFYISEDGVYALELWADGRFELQEYGMVIESGELVRAVEPDYGQIYTVDPESTQYRLLFVQEGRLYLGGCGTFAPGEKGSPEDA